MGLSGVVAYLFAIEHLTDPGRTGAVSVRACPGGGAIEELVVQHAIIIFLLVCQFAIFAGIFWAEVLGQA
jgi:hypothetical protein